MYVPLPYVIALACVGFSAGTVFGACLLSWAFERRDHVRELSRSHLPDYRVNEVV